jgi:hypothetical protein
VDGFHEPHDPHSPSGPARPGALADPFLPPPAAVPPPPLAGLEGDMGRREHGLRLPRPACAAQDPGRLAGRLPPRRLRRPARPAAKAKGADPGPHAEENPAPRPAAQEPGGLWHRQPPVDRAPRTAMVAPKMANQPGQHPPVRDLRRARPFAPEGPPRLRAGAGGPAGQLRGGAKKT